jgi:sterol 3beta-glucosyltransferase
VRLTLIALGSRGDVEPYVALGRGLVGAGHAVRLVTQEDYESLVSSNGLEFWPVAGRAQDVAQSEEMRRRLEGGNFLSILSLMAKEAQRGALRLAEGGLAASRDADILVAGIGSIFVALALAEKLKLTLVQAYYVPFTPTAAFPSFLLPKLPARLGAIANRPSYGLAQQMMWQPFRSGDAKARRQVLGLPPAPFWGPYGSPRMRGAPVLYAFSPSVIPPPADWARSVHVTGYWFLDPDPQWRPPPDLAEFLEAGPRPVYVGFGSMSNRDPEKTANLVLEALARSRQRGVILSGWGGLRKADLPKSVFMIDAAPFAWLFPRVAAVVHHGGAGTTAAGLRAGVPSVVVPFFGDQPYWGQRVADLGVGPAPIPRRRLSAEWLALAIERAVGDQTMRRRAADLGARIRAEDGVGNAVALIQESARHLGKE